jgi:hypothetical protein
VVVQDRQGRTIGGGSGFLVSTKGLIATNYHVIEDAHTADVVLADKTKLTVEGVVALDEEDDLANLRVAGSMSARPLELDADDVPRVGAKVYAIGNPQGLTQTLSDGLVSGHREIDRVSLIQTTAPISQGSSGGPLLGADGRVVGVTTSFLKVGQNLNFAVPASHVARLLLQPEVQAQLTRFPLVIRPSAEPVSPAPAPREKEYTWEDYERERKAALAAAQPERDKPTAESRTAMPWEPVGGFPPTPAQRKIQEAFAKKGRYRLSDYDQAVRDAEAQKRGRPRDRS